LDTSGAQADKMSFLEDPLEAAPALLMLKIVGNYWPE